MAKSQPVSPTAPLTAWNDGRIVPNLTQVKVSFNLAPKEG